MGRHQSSAPKIVWFRRDLRLADHPALFNAAQNHPIIPVFIWAPDEEGDWPPGAASRWWLHHALTNLDKSLRGLGSCLVLRSGPTLAALKALARESGATAVYWNRRYEPAVSERDQRIEDDLRANGIDVESYNGSLLYEPWTVAKKAGGPFQVFTPFWKTCLAQDPPAAPLSAPHVLQQPAIWPRSEGLDSFSLHAHMNRAEGFCASWNPGEKEAQNQLKSFVSKSLRSYAEARDDIDGDGLSRLSPHLHFGEIGPRQIWKAVEKASRGQGYSAAKDNPFLRQLGWREFSYHLLFHFPHTPQQPLRTRFKAFPWESDAAALTAWQQGQTGIPLVDAAMRQLWCEGWMPNRARMVVASYLTKNMLISWRDGAAWFWDTLVDADLANNTLGWQWTSGCGADAAPYFRIFNPINQAVKFDPDGHYIDRWIPALRKLPLPWRFKPWEAPPQVLSEAGVALGATYPEPWVDLRFSRERALAMYRKMCQQ